jgi:exonuclease VII small subunit
MGGNDNLAASLENYQRAVDIATENQDRDLELFEKNLENVRRKLSEGKE